MLQERVAEFGDGDLSEFEQGRRLACWKMMGIVQTQHSAILELIEDEE